MQFLNHINLNLNELRSALAEIIAGNPGSGLTEGRVWYDSTTKRLKWRTNSTNLAALPDTTTLDQIASPAASVGLNSQKIINLGVPTAGTDAANKNYVDDRVQGMAWKESVRAATTVTGTLATAYENGDAVDGVTLATGDRILLKNQSAGAENGIYTVNASGAPTRAVDADSTTDIEAATVMVEEGSTNAGTIWTLSTDNVTIGTTAQVWAQVGAGSLPTAGNGLTLTGSTLDVNTDGTTIEINADTLRVVSTGLPVASGGTGSTTAAGARTNLGAVTKYAADITGNASTTQFTVTHNLNTLDVVVQVWEVTTGELVLTDTVKTSVNAVRIDFAVAPANAKVYRVIVLA